VCASTLIALVRRYKLQAVIAFMEKAEHKNVVETVPKKTQLLEKKYNSTLKNTEHSIFIYKTTFLAI